MPATAEAVPKTAAAFFEAEAEDLLEVYEKRSRTPTERRAASQIRHLRQRRSPAEYATQIARTLFEAELLIVPQKKMGSAQVEVIE